MCGHVIIQGAMLGCVDIEAHISVNHPLCNVQMVVDGIFRAMNDGFERRYSRLGRASIPQGRLLPHVLNTIRSERQRMGATEYISRYSAKLYSLS